jgi:hypothetical protein
MDKDKRKSPLNRFIERIYKRTFGSYSEWKTARQLNQGVLSKMKKSNDGTREYWACRGCGNALLSDLNGNDAEVISGTGTRLLVNFSDMIAYCGNKDCTDRWNILEFDNADDLSDRLEKVLESMPQGVDEYQFVKRKWLELDKE